MLADKGEHLDLLRHRTPDGNLLDYFREAPLEGNIYFLMREEAEQPNILDRVVWASLIGPHAKFAEVNGKARRYPLDVSPFGAIEDPYNDQHWRDLSTLIGPGGQVVLTGRNLHIAQGWRVIDGGFGLQMTGEDVEGEVDAQAISLGVDDVPEMLGLVARTQPGPFLRRTVELGKYLGLRGENGELVAMAGCRLNPAGWREISAVCTDASQRGNGLAGRLVKAVSALIRTEGDIPFLHVSETNKNAIRLYEALGFRVRSRGGFSLIEENSSTLQDHPGEVLH